MKFIISRADRSAAKDPVFRICGAFDGATDTDALDAFAKSEGFKDFAALRASSGEPIQSFRAEAKTTHDDELRANAKKAAAEARERALAAVAEADAAEAAAAAHEVK